MSKTINGSFESRRDAEMAVERLVQEFGLERTDILYLPMAQKTVPALFVQARITKAQDPVMKTETMALMQVPLSCRSMRMTKR